MKVPFTLHKTDRPGTVTAVLLLSENPAELLALCARMSAPLTPTPLLPQGGEGQGVRGASEWPALPPIHAVAGGFLVKLGRPTVAVFPGTIRLRSRTANLFLPVDAELVPALLDDEAAGLVRERGLIFLPGGRVLAFAPDRVLTTDKLLSLPRLPGRLWRALPARPPRPEKLEEIRLELPEDASGLILESGGAGIGEETPRPASSGPIARTAGRTALGAGKGLVWLGQMLHLPGLAKLGAALAGSAMRSVPRLSEALLGRQEAALRELLRKFRAGNLEEALRHALPLSDAPGRGEQAATNAHLPTHGLIYRLSDLLSSARGPGAAWFGPADVHAELRREYQKAADDATARGDYRRAAFIYGRLLNDYRRAADVLARGGLHHDAAILYLEILRDTLAAARAFEAAGETDRALQLYQQRGDYLLAGDLLRRLGEEEEAARYYVRAADQFAATDNHLAAADLLFARAGRPDLGLRYLIDGWARRPRGSAVPCLLRLTRWCAEQDEQRQLLALVAEAEEFFAPPGNEHAAGQFFNALAQLADRDNLLTLRDDLRDRSLRGLASKLRFHAETNVRPGVAVSELFGQSGVWKAAVVSDADFALKAALKKKERPAKHAKAITANRICVGTGQVTAVCAARASGRVFLGFHNGRICWFDPHTGSLCKVPAPHPKATVIALATNDRGDRLIALAQFAGERVLFSYAILDTGYDLTARQTVSDSGTSWLTPIAEHNGRSIVGLWEGDCLRLLCSEDLVPRGTTERIEGMARSGLLSLEPYASPEMCLPVPQVTICLFIGESIWCFRSLARTKETLLHLGWRPFDHLRGLCEPPPPSWHWRRSGHLEFAGMDHEDESIHWTVMEYSDPDKPFLGAGASTQQRGYRAAALLSYGRIAGVYDRGVDWLRRQQSQLVPESATLLPLEDAVACTVSLPTRELLVICRDGSVARVPLPS
jgi:tetratricopeptide (TPR) repeat protein